MKIKRLKNIFPIVDIYQKLQVDVFFKNNVIFGGLNKLHLTGQSINVFWGCKSYRPPGKVMILKDDATNLFYLGTTVNEKSTSVL